LTDVHVELRAQIASGGFAACRLHRANIEQLRGQLVSHGLLNDGEIERFYELIEDPSFAVNSYPLVSASGRRPS